jgi:MFS family permease
LLNLGLSSGGEAGVQTGSSARALGGTSNPLAEYIFFLVAAAAILLALLIWWQQRSPNPLLPPRLFRHAGFDAALAANFVTGAALIVAMVNVPITVALLNSEDQISTVSAILLAPFTLLMAVTALAGGLVVNRLGERQTALLGAGLVTAGYVALWLGLREQNEWRMAPGLALAGAGFGFVIAPIGATAIDYARAADRGIAAAAAILFRLLGMTIGISAFTAFGVRRLQSLSQDVPAVERLPEETTAEFFLRQNQHIQEVAIPLTLQVVRETFLIAALLAALAAIPLLFLHAGAKQSGTRRG